MKKLFILIILSLMLCGLAAAQKLPEFDKAHEIKLLEMNRDDVRRIFIDYKLETLEYRKHTDLFSTDNVEIDVSYSDGKCRDEESEGWDVPEWTVTDINISPKTPIKLRDIGMYLQKYKTEKKHTNKVEPKIYHNKDFGITLEVNKDEIEEIIFFPPKKTLFINVR